MSNDRIRISDFIEEKGIEAFEKIKDFNLEGMMAKRKSSRYIQGTRSADWLKIKNIKTQDCVVIGFTKGEGNRQGYFGSLGWSGFDFDTLGKIYEKLEKIKVDSCPIRYVPYTNREPVWVRTELVAEVKFHGWTNDRIMRAPIFLRLREDKSPNECRMLMKTYTKFDWMMLDSEHSGNNPRAMEHLIRAAECVGMVPFVRVTQATDEADIHRALEAGAKGIFLPEIGSPR
jgi:ATP-dependent DNA ligase